MQGQYEIEQLLGLNVHYAYVLKQNKGCWEPHVLHWCFWSTGKRLQVKVHRYLFCSHECGKNKRSILTPSKKDHVNKRKKGLKGENTLKLRKKSLEKENFKKEVVILITGKMPSKIKNSVWQGLWYKGLSCYWDTWIPCEHQFKSWLLCFLPIQWLANLPGKTADDG